MILLTMISFIALIMILMCAIFVIVKNGAEKLAVKFIPLMDKLMR